jgi:hypothetical protein
MDYFLKLKPLYEKKRGYYLKNNLVYILSIDAKDLFLSNYLKSSDNERAGFNIRYANGEINLNRFINSLDYCLDLIKLREVYKKTYNNNLFSFIANGKEYCRSVVNVTFKYSVKEYNRLANNVYVKYGFDYKNVVLKDCVGMEGGEPIAVQVGSAVSSPLPREVLGEYFYCENGVYKARQNIKTVHNVADLRKCLYEQGFNCDGIRFVRFKRSSGAARVGKCLFIDKRLYPRMHVWELGGIVLKKGDDIDLAAFESYISLTSSSIIDVIPIKPENFLIIPDYESVFTTKAAATRIREGRLETKPKTIKTSNSIWDGQSLIDP